MGQFIKGIFQVVLMVAVIAAVLVWTIFGHTILNGPALNAAYAGVYRDIGGDTIDFHEDNSVIVNSHEVCKYRIANTDARSFTSTLEMTCGQNAPELMTLRGSSELDVGNAVGPPTTYKHISDRLGHS